MSRTILWISVGLIALVAGIRPPGANASPSRTLAVLPSLCVGAYDLSLEATVRLQEELAKTGKFKLVERNRIDEVLKVISEGHTRDYDSSTTASVGRLVAARFVCFGSVTNPSVSKTPLEMHTGLRAYATLGLRLVEVESGQVLFDGATTEVSEGWEHTTTEEALLGDALGQAAKVLVRDLSEALPAAGMVVEITSEKTALIDLGTTSGVTRGTRFLVLRDGGLASRPDGTSVMRPDVVVGELEVVHVGVESSVAKIRSGRTAIAPGDRVTQKLRKHSSFDDW